MDFEAAFSEHHDALFRYLHRLTGDEDVAEDIAQEAFVRLLDHSIPRPKVRSWLFTVATNLVRDRARTRERRGRLLEGENPGPSPPDRPDEEAERSRRVAAVRAALDRIPERDREMLLMREEGFKYREIAEAVDVAPSSVGKLLSRALDRFEEAYEEEIGA